MLLAFLYSSINRAPSGHFTDIRSWSRGSAFFRPHPQARSLIEQLWQRFVPPEFWSLVAQVAAEAAAPLAKTNEIVMLNDDRPSVGLSGELTRLIGQLPPSISALTGIDLSKVQLPLLIISWPRVSSFFAHLFF